jgi:hypothetical protein
MTKFNANIPGYDEHFISMFVIAEFDHYYSNEFLLTNVLVVITVINIPEFQGNDRHSRIFQS